jgi:hypothetical protein
MADELRRPSKRLRTRGAIAFLAGLVVIVPSLAVLGGPSAQGNSPGVWLSVLGFYAGLIAMLVGAGMFVVGTVKRWKEPKEARPPRNWPTVNQAAILLVSALILTLACCAGMFFGAIDEEGKYWFVTMSASAGFAIGLVLIVLGLGALIWSLVRQVPPRTPRPQASTVGEQDRTPDSSLTHIASMPPREPATPPSPVQSQSIFVPLPAPDSMAEQPPTSSPAPPMASLTRWSLLALSLGLLVSVGSCIVLQDDPRGNHFAGAVSLWVMPVASVVLLGGFLGLVFGWIKTVGRAASTPSVPSSPEVEKPVGPAGKPSPAQGVILAASGIVLAATSCAFFLAGLNSNSVPIAAVHTVGFFLGLIFVPVGVIWAIVRIVKR